MRCIALAHINRDMDSSFYFLLDSVSARRTFSLHNCPHLASDPGQCKHEKRCTLPSFMVAVAGGLHFGADIKALLHKRRGYIRKRSRVNYTTQS